MITAVDTSVLISIAKGEAGSSAWVDLLADARKSGELIICDVVAAEYYALLLSEEKFRETLLALAISFAPASLEAAQLAGSIFKQYRGEGGPREHLIPDFLIGAHAQTEADRIAAIDRGSRLLIPCFAPSGRGNRLDPKSGWVSRDTG
jgi:predicted nucleic acid-binding protein